MGRQIGFYMTEVDEALFLAYVHGLTETRLEPAEQPPTPDGCRPGVGAMPDRYWTWFLWRPDVDPPPTRRTIGLHHVDERSQAIEFTRAGYLPRHHRLLAGRLWIYTYAPRPDHFLKWYGNVSSWIRRNCRRDSQGAYWGPDALSRWPDLFENPPTTPLPRDAE